MSLRENKTCLDKGNYSKTWLFTSVCSSWITQMTIKEKGQFYYWRLESQTFKNYFFNVCSSLLTYARITIITDSGGQYIAKWVHNTQSCLPPPQHWYHCWQRRGHPPPYILQQPRRATKQTATECCRWSRYFSDPRHLKLLILAPHSRSWPISQIFVFAKTIFSSTDAETQRRVTLLISFMIVFIHFIILRKWIFLVIFKICECLELSCEDLDTEATNIISLLMFLDVVMKSQKMMMLLLMFLVTGAISEHRVSFHPDYNSQLLPPTKVMKRINISQVNLKPYFLKASLKA